MSAHAGAVPVQTAIDRIGFGRFQKRLLGVCGVTWAADAAEIFLIAFALPKITDDFGLSTFQSSARRLLRRSSACSPAPGSGAPSPTASAASAASRSRSASSRSSASCRPSRPTCGCSALFRILAGFGLGGAVPLDFSLFAEYLPTRNRGRWLVILESFWGVGTVVAARRWPGSSSRRSAGATCSAAPRSPARCVFWVRLRIPESPRFLAATGRVDEAEAILGQVARENGVTGTGRSAHRAARRRQRQGRDQAPVRGQARPHHGDAVEHLVLHRARLLRPLRAGCRRSSPSAASTSSQTYGYTLLLAAAQLPGYFSAAWLVERWGRSGRS